MANININDLYINFYTIVDKIIYNIHINKIINNHLFYCNYYSLNEFKIFTFPLTICLGGGGFIQYNQIFKDQKLTDNIKLQSKDYDISFSFKNIGYTNTDKIHLFIKEINTIYNNCIKELKYNGLSTNNFILTHVINNNRLHFRIECKPYFPNEKQLFHILELSFWFNSKISDNFTINDFIKKNLYIYEYKSVYYYLLPLDLLVKTLLYAIVDFFEKRNFKKCIKYLDRVKFIKEMNDNYIKINGPNKCILTIFNSYISKIKRKYKLINDYPFILAPKMVNIKNNGIIKCIYRNLRKNNRKEIDKLLDKYNNDCKNEKNYNPELSELTFNNTDDDITI